MSQLRARFIIGLLLLGAILGLSSTHLALANTSNMPNLSSGDSVVGMGKLIPDVEIHTSGGNDVLFIKERSAPGVYGANYQGLENVLNTCMPYGWAIADRGTAPNYEWPSKQNSFEFSFTSGKTISRFSLGILDWGDYLAWQAQNAADLPGHHTLMMTAYNVVGDVVDEFTYSFDTEANPGGRGLPPRYLRPSTQFPNYTPNSVFGLESFGYGLKRAGDACEAQLGQPGKLLMTVEGSGITHVEVKFADQNSMDPNVAIFFPADFMEWESSSPEANDDNASGRPSTPLDIDVLGNDNNPNGDILTITSYDATSENGGTVFCSTTCRYTSAPGFVGLDTINYTVCNSAGLCDTAVVVVDVWNTPPDAIDDNASTTLNQPVSIQILSNDSDPDGDVITLTSFDATSQYGGSVSCLTDTCTYRPAFVFTGVDSFNYIICDPYDACDTAIVTISVTNTVGNVGCARTQGYWQTHSEFGPSSYDATWGQLPNGASTTFFLSGLSYYKAITSPTKGNAYFILAQQYIGTELNIRSGDSIPDTTLSVFQTAKTLFEQKTPVEVTYANNKPLRDQFLALAAILDAYNKGTIGPGHCK